MICLEGKFILALLSSYIVIEGVSSSHISMYYVQRKYLMSDFLSLTVISYRIVLSLSDHLASLLNWQMNIKCLLLLNLNSVICLNWSEEHFNFSLLVPMSCCISLIAIAVKSFRAVSAHSLNFHAVFKRKRSLLEFYPLELTSFNSYLF